VAENGKVTDAEFHFADGGQMGALMRSHDWSQTLFGSVSGWAQSLKTTTSILLNSRYPMFLWWGKDYAKLYNDAYIPVLGANKHPQFLGQSARDCWAEIWDVIGPLAESVLTTGQPTWSEDLLLLMNRYGYREETYFTFSYSPVRDESGGVGGVFCACSETTDSIIGERRLGTLRELATNTAIAKTVQDAYQIAIETLAKNPKDIPFTLLYQVDTDGKQANLVRTTGINPGTSASPIQVDLTVDLAVDFAKEFDQWHLAKVNQTRQCEKLENLETRFPLLPAGYWNESPHTALVMPLAQSGKQQLAGLLVIGVSPQRKLDEKYQGFFDLVAANVATAIANADAYEAERKRTEALIELDRAKTIFFSNVSHEFRTPLTLMLSPLEDVLANANGQLPPQQRETLEIVHRNGLRLLKLVNTLLDFSRIEAGRFEAVYEPIDLASFTVELASVFRSAIERAGLELIVECPPLPEPVYVDRDMWEKILFNLLSNAFKFTLDGAITVRLEAVEHQVKLTVQDTGVGIPTVELPRLFDRFHRVSGTRARTHEGSGIGLALVQELVKLHGGSIDAASVLEQGTTFTVTLPLGQAHLPPERIQSDRTLQSTIKSTMQSTAMGAAPFVEEALRWTVSGENGEWEIENQESLTTAIYESPISSRLFAKILLAEDNADMREYVKRLLSRQYEVEAVADGVAALAAIERLRPDIVLTDVMMPQLDGIELLQALRANPQTQDLPIILLSARAGEEARVEGLEKGADDYLVKPFSARELLARVEGTLKLARLRQESSQRQQVLLAASEAAKQETEAAYQELNQVLENMTDAFVLIDQEWRIVYQNAEGEKINNKPRSEILGKTLWEEWSASVGSNIEYQYRRAVAEQIPVHFEHHYYLPPNYDVWLEIHAYPSAQGLGIFYRNITDRKQAEIALQKSEERYRYLAETIPQLVWTANAEGFLLDLNQRWSNFTGLTLAQAQAGGWEAIVHPEDIPILNNSWKQAQENGCNYQAEGRIRRFDGVYRWHLHQAVPAKNELGQIIKWFGTATDIEIQKQLEQERDYIYQQEQIARTEAERANRIKDEFLAVLSHELRTPLNPILGWSKLLRAGKLNPTKTAEALATIERNAKLQVQLIEDLLDVSRILRGKLALTINLVDLASVITAARDTVNLAAEAKKIDIQTIIEPGVGSISGDAGRLQQVIWNLLSNAVKFTPPSGQVSVCLTQVNSNAQIQVTDNGKGINPEFLPHVFDYFRQADSATTRQFGGLGLGLAIARQIVELHGGTIYADSSGEGQGATFTVKLPVSTPALETSLDEDTISSSLSLKGLNIIVVDDEVDSLEFAAFVLEEAGATVTAVNSAITALQIILKSKPDVLVSDIAMPEMDGYMLMNELKVIFGQTIPAIALSAFAGEYNQQQSLMAGFQQHISKPINPEELVEAIISLNQPK
jgi:PAS domain S-box-containing protein